MFTGLIEGTGRVVRIAGGSLVVEQTLLRRPPSPGESLAVDGACLTVRSQEGPRLVFDCSGETLARTIAGGYAPGTVVNLERPVALGDLLHGHLVTGHVDCTARVLRMERTGGGATAWFSFPPEHALLLVEKGSAAVSGISLTVASLAPDRFSAALVPETLERTTAGSWAPGHRVNLEFDIVGKYVVRSTGAALAAGRLREQLG